MLKPRLLGLFLIVVATASVQAQNYKTAVGLRLSTHDAVVNNSVTIKHFVNRVVALEGLISFKPVALGVLAEVHQPLSSLQGLRFLFGGGGYVQLSEGVGAGAQGILGLDYKFVKAPLNLTVDWKPELNLIDDFRFEPAAVGFSARFSFK